MNVLSMPSRLLFPIMLRRLCLLFLTMNLASLQADPEPRVFELRTYHANEGKLAALQSRFRDHTLSLFEKHGMTSVGYWVPVDNKDNLLIYLLSYPNKESRATAWEGFRGDPTWKAAYAASIEDGKLVGKIDTLFLQETDFSSPFTAVEGPPRVFEMRTYTTAPGMLPHLETRFREHTCSLFKKHGMTNLGYFELAPEQRDSPRTLLYFLAHKNAESAKESWKAFRTDPEWRKVAAASEKTAGGPILIKAVEKRCQRRGSQ